MGTALALLQPQWKRAACCLDFRRFVISMGRQLKNICTGLEIWQTRGWLKGSAILSELQRGATDLLWFRGIWQSI
jgi:hypothetical protein